MYSENLRSFLRTTIRKVISDWTKEKEAGPIARHVLDVVLLDHEFTYADMQEGLYAIIYDETLLLLKGTGHKEKGKLNLEQLLLWKVPETQAKIIVELDQRAVYVPSTKSFKPLFGDDRIKLRELGESVDHYKAEASANERKAILLERLFKNPGRYYK